MGSDDLFKKRRAERKKRKHDFKPAKANSYLIVTEGEKTEPFYFKGMQQQIQQRIGGRVDVVQVPHIDIHGEGCGTSQLLAETERIIKKAPILYQNVWVLFDKDDFNDFDEAIKEGERRGYHVGWSNQSFEYWLFLHFNYSEAALHRDDWEKKLNAIFKEYQLGDGYYRKNDENLYALVDTYNGVNTAIKNAKRRMVDFVPGKIKPSAYDPGSTVYQLVEELKGYLEE